MEPVIYSYLNIKEDRKYMGIFSAAKRFTKSLRKPSRKYKGYKSFAYTKEKSAKYYSLKNTFSEFIKPV